MRHATIICADTGWVYADWEAPRMLPDNWTAGGLGALLRRVAGRTGTSEGVLLLDANATSELGLTENGDQAGIVEAVRNLGWHTAVDSLRSWTRFQSGDRVMHLGVLPWMPAGRFALEVRDGDELNPRHTADALGLWHDLTGSAYSMSPGVASLNVLRRMADGGRTKVVWKSTTGPKDAYEDRQTGADWWQGYPGQTVHLYDARRAGLAAAGNAEVSPYPLRPGKRQFDPTAAGWWQCEIPACNFSDHMPHPAGPGLKPGMVKWLTTPTVQLLHQLAAEGVIAAPVIVDAYTGPARRLFRTWAARMDTAYRFAAELTAQPGPTVADALKRGAAREAHGMMAAGTGAIQREDWFHTITAVKRANVWRKAWQIGRNTGLWPVGIDDDTIVYPTDAVASYFPLGNRLGQYRTQMRSL